MPTELLADVAVRATIPGADPIFTYRVPPMLRALVRPGQLVWAPLRRQRVQGIVLDCYAWQDDPPPRRTAEATFDDLPTGVLPSSALPLPNTFLASPGVIRDLSDVADPAAALTPGQIRLARWLASHYRASLYDCLALMLPPGVAQEAEIAWRATAEGARADLGALPERERAVLYYLRRHGETDEKTLRAELRGSDTDLRHAYADLRERGLLDAAAQISRPRARPKLERMVQLTLPHSVWAETLAALARAPKQQRMLEALIAIESGDGDERQERRPFPASELFKASDGDLATLRALEARGAVAQSTREVRRDPLAGDAVAPDVPPQLSADQERVWRAVSRALDRKPGDTRPGDRETRDRETETERSDQTRSVRSGATETERSETAFLLHGVTGPGKTEIYLRAIGRTLRQGKQALVMVPEIALTAQLVRRFAARFPGRLAVLHSNLSLGERYDEWRRLRSGEASLAIGSRSACFAPLPNLGVIIVDEEHDTSYKHDASPRYNGRDVARQLAAISGSVLILGSATPAIESYTDARDGRLTLLELPERVGMARGHDGLPRPQALPLPPVRIVDMRRELQSGNRSIFSAPLQDALIQTIEGGEQAILFINRRGAASFVMCRDCGQVVECPNCSSPLTVHYIDADGRLGVRSPDTQPGDQSTILICHGCGHRELPPTFCPNCYSPRVKSFGIGTQRVVEEVERLFPGTAVLRWDRDAVGRKGAHQRLLDTFLNREAQVLVGTQMIAKGLDLPGVSLVGVVAADTGLHLPDFRAAERAFQLLTQVAGRAGRRSAGAKVVMQSYNPEHYALLAAQEHSYSEFYTQEMAFRRQTGYPPFGRLVRFVTAAGTDERGRRAAAALAEEVQTLAGRLDLGTWRIVGPAPAFFHIQRNRYRWHLLLLAERPDPLIAAIRLPSGWTMDIDPVQVL